MFKQNLAQLICYTYCMCYLQNIICSAIKVSDSCQKYPIISSNIKNITSKEFIIKYKYFYWTNTRNNFLRAALTNGNISNWEIVNRKNMASEYPSDFDIVIVKSENIGLKEMKYLEKHPSIKMIEHHGNVRRSIKAYGFRIHRLNPLIYNNRSIPLDITTALQANTLWKRGITGKGIKVAIFDTGLSSNHPHFRNVKERSNWTNEKSLEDAVSHGTFVAGVIASSKECLGLAPDVELHIYKVFTNNQVSYTSWFLDAFNYAIFKKINVLNLSIGGPDFLDRPFVDKVLELSANKIIMVSAIGNDGPFYGTLNNPGDQSDVIGVGGINFEDKVAKFSSRGMTTWELPLGYGRVKPDIVTLGSHVKGSNVNGGCRLLSGTSVASPIVAGAIALILSGALNKLNIINPASMKQILFEGSTRLYNNNMFEQGHGKLNITKSMDIISNYTPKVTLSPTHFDSTENYMWPYSSQPLYCDSMPIIINITILNGVSVFGKVLNKPSWNPHINNEENYLKVAISYSTVLWPWCGWMAVYLSVHQNGCNFEGIARGHISLTVDNPLPSNKTQTIKNVVNFPINVNIIPKPPRKKRIIWDQYHNLRYPPGYIPRDNLNTKSDPLDWRADHLHTNFRDMYNHLRNSGYYIDILRMPFTCFNASNYGTLLLVDLEEEFFDEEVNKLEHDVYDHGLSVILFADWYNTTVMKKLKFFDENTRQWWIPDTGGSNIPALNDLLKPFGIALGDFVGEGYIKLGDRSIYIASGSSIVQYPDYIDNILIEGELNDQGAQIINNLSITEHFKKFVPILGLFQAKASKKIEDVKKKEDAVTSYYKYNSLDHFNKILDLDSILKKRLLLKLSQFNSSMSDSKSIKIVSKQLLHHKSEGRIAIFGDSNCVDSTYLEHSCFWLLDALLEFTMNSYRSKLFKKIYKKSYKFEEALPLRLTSSNLHKYSSVLNSKHKFKKLSIVKCESYDWAEANTIKTNMNNDFIKLLQTIQAKQVHYPTNPDGNFLALIPKFEKITMKKATGYNNLSFILVVLTTIIILGFVLGWLKKRKRNYINIYKKTNCV